LRLRDHSDAGSREREYFGPHCAFCENNRLTNFSPFQGAVQLVQGLFHEIFQFRQPWKTFQRELRLFEAERRHSRVAVRVNSKEPKYLTRQENTETEFEPVEKRLVPILKNFPGEKKKKQN
jgi:hypothetical protein